MPALDCSIVVRAYNEEKHLERLLTGIERQVEVRAETILVDSGSTDQTVAVASRFPVTILSISPTDFTFGRSLNLGCSKARGEIIVLASAHVYPVYPDWLHRLIEPFQDSRVALTYGKQRGNSSTRFSEQQVFAKLYPDQPPSRPEHPFCNNANAALRRELWMRRPYDEELSGLEDLEWAMWAHGQGHQVTYVAEAEVVHVHDETPRQVYNRYRREAIALKRLRPNEHFGLTDLLWLFASNVLSDGWHGLRQGRGPRSWAEIGWYRLMQFWGTYRGFSHLGPLTPELRRTFYYPRGLAERSVEPARAIEPIDYGMTASKG